eukprot:UN25472
MIDGSNNNSKKEEKKQDYRRNINNDFKKFNGGGVQNQNNALSQKEREILARTERLIQESGEMRKQLSKHSADVPDDVMEKIEIEEAMKLSARMDPTTELLLQKRHKNKGHEDE